jgi:hypothetical protein
MNTYQKRIAFAGAFVLLLTAAGCSTDLTGLNCVEDDAAVRAGGNYTSVCNAIVPPTDTAFVISLERKHN